MSLTRQAYAQAIHRKLDDLASNLSYVAAGDQTEGDYTDAIDSALRDCGFSAVSEADTDMEIRALMTGVEYHALSRVTYKFLAKPTTQQGAGASGLHLMVQTETTVRSLRLVAESVRKAYADALAGIGRSLSLPQVAVGGVLIAEIGDPLTEDVIIGVDALPWFTESEV